MTHVPGPAEVRQALAGVEDPEIRRPITELGMVDELVVGDEGEVRIHILLTVAACPLRGTIVRDVERAASDVPGVTAVEVTLGVMTPEQRAQIRVLLRGGDGSKPREIPFNQPGSTTRIYAIASGKGGVGKSSITANLGAAMAADGLKVGILDADVHGFSIPAMLGVSHPPTRLDDMILPPIAQEVKVISIGSFVRPDQAVLWRGPMLHRALEQFLTDVFWGDLDVLLLDLPPGTGDIAISTAQLLPQAELIVVTTPQTAAAAVAERAGAIAGQTEQKVAGVVENMAWLELPDGTHMQVFGDGGGARVAENLSRTLSSDIPLLAQVPLEQKLREGGDSGNPLVLSEPDSPAARALLELARGLGHRPRGLAGKNLGISPA